jgi:hypothetical protein
MWAICSLRPHAAAAAAGLWGRWGSGGHPPITTITTTTAALGKEGFDDDNKGHGEGAETARCVMTVMVR